MQTHDWGIQIKFPSFFKSLSLAVLSNRFGINGAKYFTIPRNCCISLAFVGLGKFVRSDILPSASSDDIDVRTESCLHSTVLQRLLVYPLIYFRVFPKSLVLDLTLILGDFFTSLISSIKSLTFNDIFSVTAFIISPIFWVVNNWSWATCSGVIAMVTCLIIA